MENDAQTRLRLSTDFFLQIIVMLTMTLFILIGIANAILHKQFDSVLLALLGVIVIFCFLIRFMLTRPKVEYDDLSKTLFIIDRKTKKETEIPVRNITHILYSIFGFGRGTKSYVIKYQNPESTEGKVRVFTRMFDNSMSILINDVKSANPDLITRNWSVGFNELAD